MVAVIILKEWASSVGRGTDLYTQLRKVQRELFVHITQNLSLLVVAMDGMIGKQRGNKKCVGG
jgi:hypothetical protein